MARNLRTENGFGQRLRATFTRGDGGVIGFWMIVHESSPRMPRPRLFDEDEVLERAMRTFWAKGYRDTSVEDLVAATGVRAGSLYNAFPGGKHALFLAALDRYSRLVVPVKLGELASDDAGVPEIRAYFDGLVADLTTREGRAGCLMVNSAVELADSNTDVAQAVTAHMRRLERNATRALRNARVRDPEARAKLLVATAFGLMVVGKTGASREVLEAIVDSAFAGLQ
jgi:TetR/AcrR family transcriptional repressor of nem operon